VWAQLVEIEAVELDRGAGEHALHGVGLEPDIVWRIVSRVKGCVPSSCG
jgi:hypothetical protein